MINELCTSLKQSKQLIEYGLLSDTADFSYNNSSFKGPNYTEDFVLSLYPYDKAVEITQKHSKFWEAKPAWSLIRLIELIEDDVTILKNEAIQVGQCVFDNHPDKMNNMVDCIKWLIEEGDFNINYLSTCEEH